MTRIEDYLKIVGNLITKAEDENNLIEVDRLCSQAIQTLQDTRQKIQERIDKNA